MDVLDYLNKFLGDPNEKELKKLRPLVKKVRDAHQSSAVQALTLEDLPKKTEEFKAMIAREYALVEKQVKGLSLKDL